MGRAKRPPRRRSAPVRRSPSLPSAPSLEAVKAKFGAYLATAEARRRMARLPGGVGVGFFAYAYLGMATPACHQRWYAEFEKHHRIVFLAPRNHGKSTAASVVYASHAIITNRNLRVLLIRRTKTAAAKGLRMVREILAREAVVRDWAVPEEGGSFQRKGLSWTSSYFYLARGLDAMDPTFEVVGFGGAITGGHFDLIILDDVEDDKSTLTERPREKTLEWFRGTVLPMLEVGGRVIVIGTRKHGDDLYGRLWKDPTFTVIEDKAILEWPDMSRVRWVEKRDPRTGRAEIVDVEIPADAPGKCLWPEKNSMRVLLLAQKSIGSILFTREYQNEITDDLATPFRPDWMQAAKARGAGQGFLTGGVVAARGRELAEDVAQHPYCEGLYLYQCWDFALVDDAKRAQRQDADWCVGQTWGYDWEVGERYLLRMVRRRGLSQGQIQALVRAEAALFPQRVAVIVENNNFGRLIEMGLRASSSLPLFGHTTDRRKHDLYEGVPAMSTDYENGKVILPYGGALDLPADQLDPRPLVDVYVTEHTRLGKESHDDTVMCEWIGVTWLRRFIQAELRRRRMGLLTEVRVCALCRTLAALRTGQDECDWCLRATAQAA